MEEVKGGMDLDQGYGQDWAWRRIYKGRMTGVPTEPWLVQKADMCK